MGSLELDGRSKRDIIDEIRTKAAAYTPEWRMDEENPDIGTALALVYGEIFSKTVKNFNKVPLKNKIEFYNQLGGDLLPALPSEGYVEFSLVNEEVPGVEVPLGTVMSADVDSDPGVVRFETKNDLFVTPAKINVIYQTNDSLDYIDRIYQPAEETEAAEQKETVFFDFSGVNLQGHTLVFSHDDLLNIKKNAWLELCFYYREERLVPEEILEQLADKKNVSIEYYSAEGFVPFPDRFIREGRIVLSKNEKMPPFARTEIGGKESFVIQCTVHEIDKLKNLEIERFFLKAKGLDIPCDTITSNGVECNMAQFFPFGERFYLFNEVYFGSEEVFCKKGANITVTFNLDYASVPLEYGIADIPFEYKWITDRASFKANPDYDVTIEEIIWEYYNGSGWTRLFKDSSYSNLFSTENGAIGQYKTMNFVCPDDIRPILVNAAETYYIRARILKINNLYKMKGNYISPFMTNLGLSYNYGDTWVAPSQVTISNNLESTELSYQDMLNLGGFKPFMQTGLEKAAVYLGFHTAPKGAPVRLLFTMRDSTARKSTNLRWEYFSGGAWQPMNMVDETEGFLHSGIVSFMSNRLFTRKKLFGEERYWIRIVDENDFYSGGSAVLPSILGFHMNVTEMINVDSTMKELFTMEIYQENKKFVLQKNHVIAINAFVNEADGLTEKELEQLKAAKAVRCVYDEAGLLTQAWVRWKQVDHFLDSVPADRHYIVNRTEGTVLFGNGRHGRIPSASRVPNITIEYKTGGGRRTNLPVGAVKKLDRSIGFINLVTNPEKLTGGFDVEPFDEAVDRCASMLRLQDRAVTARDYEELARYATRNIGMVKCFAGLDDKSEKLSGAVTLVVLRKDYKTNRTQFAPIREEIYRYLKGRVNGNLIALRKLFIVEPKFIELRARIELIVDNMNDIFSVKKSVQERLDRFLDVVEGNFDGGGWSIGQLPNEIQLRNAIIEIDGIQQIKKIFIGAFTSEVTGWKETDMEIVRKNRYVLPLSGVHEILITLA